MKMMSVKKRDQGGNTVAWGWKEAEKTKVFKRVYKGVPDRWRMAAWWTMAEDSVGRWKGKGRETRSAEELADEYKVGGASARCELATYCRTALTYLRRTMCRSTWMCRGRSRDIHCS
jgi:hypothetical protein